jgi:hypothetical protein
MMRSIGLVAALSLTACSGSVGFLIKDPIVDKCTNAGIRGCPDLTDGVILFIEGKQDEGRDKVLHGAAANSPEQLKKFALVLKFVGEIPGAAEYMEPVLEVTRIILDEAKAMPSARNGKVAASKAVAEKSVDRDEKPSARLAAVQASTGPSRSLTADTDADRIESGFTSPALNPSHVSCDSPFGLGSAWCATVVKGPFVVTDLHAGPGCQGDVFAAAGDAESRAWALAGSPLSPLDVHGGRIVVRQGATLVIGAGGKGAGDPRCAVTWSGFRPYRKPQDVVAE